MTVEPNIELEKAKELIKIQAHEITRQNEVISTQDKTIDKLFNTVFKLSNVIDKVIDSKKYLK